MAWSPIDSEASARFDCTERIYRYFIPKLVNLFFKYFVLKFFCDLKESKKNPRTNFKENDLIFWRGDLDADLIRDAGRRLIGEKDYRNFCKMDIGNGVVTFLDE